LPLGSKERKMNRLPKLTPEELAAMCETSLVPPTAATRNSARKKLEEIQDMLVDRAYIEKVNALIPTAEKMTQVAAQKARLIKDTGGKSEFCFDKVFHGYMNALTRAAGIRNL
jgi:hypothetical protein